MIMQVKISSFKNKQINILLIKYIEKYFIEKFLYII